MQQKKIRGNSESMKNTPESTKTYRRFVQAQMKANAMKRAHTTVKAKNTAQANLLAGV
uniref:Uncharacterized protein n=1 Tax=Tetraselmis sp. GSL018 TaxID=582737 RepID=A0A061R9F1_9CHLO